MVAGAVCALLLLLATPSAQGSAYERLVDSLLDFALQGFGLLDQSEPGRGSTLVSPYSVYSVLMMAHLGARGKTARQICHTLGLCTLNMTEVHEAFGRLAKDLATDAGLEDGLTSANALFVQSGVNVSRHYAYALRHWYSSDLAEADFQDGGQALNTVNAWVQKETRGRIQAVLHKAPSPDTRMMLVNAVHFRSEWKWQFNPLSTEPQGHFYVSPHHRVRVPMMATKLPLALGHSPELRAAILELPFARDRLSMLLVLPDLPGDLQQVLQSLNSTTMKSLIASMKKTEVNVRLPRFTVDHSPQLTGLLWTLGVRDLFSPSEADLGGITEDVYVKNIVHRALIQVDEKGSVASAATLGVVDRVGNVDEQYFEANRPFLFLLVDKKTGVVLFIGRISGF